MSKLDDVRDEHDSAQLLDPVDQLDTIRGSLADGESGMKRFENA